MRTAGSAWRLALEIMSDMHLQPETYGYRSTMGLHNAVWAVVRQAERAAEVARGVGADNPELPTIPRIPDVTLPPNRIRYRVVVSSRDESGVLHTTAVDLISDSPMSRSEIHAEVFDMVRNMTNHPSGSAGWRAVQQLWDVAPWDTRIISVVQGA